MRGHPFRRSSVSRLVAAIAPIAAAASALAAPPTAHVVLDGSLGPGGAIQPVSGVYSVTANLGTQVGPNLFHSFSQLNLTAGEVASFSGPTSVQTVLARVTGGSSNIDGTLQCTIPGANFFLINPAGVVFGPDAHVDLQGSFAVATASQVRLGASGVFAASTTPGASVLTTAAPSAFGFLGSGAPASIAVNGSTLQAPAGKSILAAAGSLTMAGGTLSAPGGSAGVAAVGAGAQVSFDPASLFPSLIVAAPAAGPIALTGGATIATDGIPAGAISVQCGDFSLAGASALTARSQGAAAGAGISVVAASLSATDGSTISTTSTGAGNAGSIAVNIAGQALLSGADSTGAKLSGIYASSNAAVGGSAGAITVNAGSLQILGGAEIASSTFGTGAGGNVTVNVSGQATLSGAESASSPSAIFATTHLPAGGGDAGSIVVSAGGLAVSDGAGITSGSAGTGRAGAVTVNVAGSAVLSGAMFGLDAGIASNSQAPGAGGSAGPVTVSAGSLQESGGAVISSTTFGQGAGGAVTVSVGGTVAIDGVDAAGHASGIFANTQSTGAGGDAGAIAVSASGLSITGGAIIGSDTFGAGRGGSVAVNVAGAAAITGASPAGADSGIYASAEDQSTDAAGSVSVSAASLQASGGGQIGSSTFGAGAGGNVTLKVSGLAVFNGADPAGYTSGVFAQSEPSGPAGAAGAIGASFGSLQLLNGAEIASSTFGQGAGGDVNVNVAGQLLASGDGPGAGHAPSGVEAESNSSGARGAAGNINLTVGSLVELGGAQTGSSTFGTGAGGSVNVQARGLVRLEGASADTGLSTGIFAESESSGAGGSAGDIHLSAGSFQAGGGAIVDSSTFGLGRGGDVTVAVRGAAALAGADAEGIDAAISADSRPAGAGGDAGNVTFSAASLKLLNGAAITSQSSGQGAGGAVSVSVAGRALLLGADQFVDDGGIFADSDSTGAGGAAGSIVVSAGRLVVRRGAQVSSSTFGLGRGGDVTVNARGGIIVAGADSTQSDSGIYATSEADGPSGNAGSVSVSAGSLRVLGGAEVSSGTFGSGSAGTTSVHVAGGVVVAGLDSTGGVSDIDSEALGGGSAGSLSLRARSLLLNGYLNVEADQSSAGDLNVNVADFVVNAGQLFASSAGSAGGNLSVIASHRFAVVDGLIDAAAAGNGGRITLSAPAIALQRSEVNGLSGGVPVKVTIRGDLLLGESQILTDTRQAFPQFDLSGVLAPLSAPAPEASRPLPDVCGARLGSTDFSSFLVTGRGGAPPSPAGWQTDNADERRAPTTRPTRP